MTVSTWTTLCRSMLLVSIALTASYVSAEGQKRPQKKPPTSATHAAASAGATYAADPRVKSFATDVAMRRDLDPVQVWAWLQQARALPSVQKLMLPPTSPQAKNWGAYRARFIEPVRLQAGEAFWRQNQRWLEQAEAETGVPASLIVGVIGVETLYGRHMGRFRTLDALVTLAFDFPGAHPRAEARQAYFRDELEQFLTLCQRQGLDPLSLRSSYAGAMGMPQFMPGSWARHAVDFDGDGRIDLFGSAADAIGSVANYFKAHGWRPGQPTHHLARVRSRPAELDVLLAPDILPTFTLQRLQEQGVELVESADHPIPRPEGNSPLALIELFNGDVNQGGQAPSYVIGTDNFYTVTRYNWSSYYALAVIELGEAIARQRQGLPPRATAARPAERVTDP